MSCDYICNHLSTVAVAGPRVQLLCLGEFRDLRLTGYAAKRLALQSTSRDGWSLCWCIRTVPGRLRNLITACGSTQAMNLIDVCSYGNDMNVQGPNLGPLPS
jgi:hypothetical protein